MVGAQRQPWDQIIRKTGLTLKGLGMCGNNPYTVERTFVVRFPGLSLRPNRWAKISERLRRKLNPPVMNLPAPFVRFRGANWSYRTIKINPIGHKFS